MSAFSSPRASFRMPPASPPCWSPSFLQAAYPPRKTRRRADAQPDPVFAAMYGRTPRREISIFRRLISRASITQLLRQEVAYPTREQPGTIVVDTTNRFLYVVRENGRALRYGIGVGKEGLAWSGRATVGRKAMWPSWTPTNDMIRREPDRNKKWADGMPGGFDNPLGPRALYLYADGTGHALPHPRNVGTAIHRHGRVERMHPPVQPGHHRSLQPRARRHAGGRAEQQDARTHGDVVTGRPIEGL